MRAYLSIFWNVGGLGDASKCDNVLSNLLCTNPGVVLLQETKLDDPHILYSPVILTNILSPEGGGRLVASFQPGLPMSSG